jgi:hypothetical protein
VNTIKNTINQHQPRQTTMYNAALVRISANKKTGPIPVSMTTANTCPTACPLASDKVGGCYAAIGPGAIAWRNLDNGKRGNGWAAFCEDVKSLPRGQLWRHNSAGDLPSADKATIDAVALELLVKANKGKRGFTYTHYNPDHALNGFVIEAANRSGFTINLSGNNISHALELFELNIAPVVTLLPIEAPNVQTVNGVKVVACPAEKSDKVTCQTCQLCQLVKRDYIIGFRVHGSGKKKAGTIAAASNLIFKG